MDAFLAGAFLADEFDFFEVDAFAALFDVLGPDVDARAAHRTRCDGYDGRFLRVNTRLV